MVTKIVIAENTHSLNNIRFRGFHGDEDYPHILNILTSCKTVDGLVRSDTLVDIIRTYTHLHNCDPYTDMLFAEVAGETIGYTRVWWDIDGNEQFIGFNIGFVHPDFRRRGIGTTLLSFNERRLKEIATQLIKTERIPLDSPAFYDHYVFQDEKDRMALLTRHGYQPVRYEFGMLRPNLEDIPAAPMPPGLEVRPVLPEHYQLIYRASCEAFRDHWGSLPWPEEDFDNMLNDPDVDPSLWRVAWDGDQVAGMVLSYIDQDENIEYHRKRGYTEGISVRRPWRKRGLARSLLVQSLHALKERGMDEAGLGVDTENLSGALHLYESVGFRPYRRDTICRKPFKVV